MVCLAVREKKNEKQKNLMSETLDLFTKYLLIFALSLTFFFPDQWLGILKKSTIKIR